MRETGGQMKRSWMPEAAPLFPLMIAKPYAKRGLTGRQRVARAKRRKAARVARKITRRNA